MEIVIFSKQAQPFWAVDSRAGDIGSLAESLAKLGAAVHLITPVPPQCELSDPSLARRLAPIRVEDAEIAQWFQFEKTGPHGLFVHLLQPKQSGSPQETETLARDGARAASALVASMEQRPDWIVSFDEDNELAELLSTKSEGRTPSFLIVTERFGANDGLARSVELSDAIAACGSFAYQLASMDAVPDLPSRLEDGSLVIERTPRLSTELSAPTSRSSAKASLQLRLGLPVSRDVPVLLVDEEVLTRRAQLMRQLLVMNVQIVATRRPDKADIDIKQFEDRFAVSDGPADELLCGVDGCLVWQDPSLVSLALHLGAIPIATPRAGLDLVDIEPNLLSGSGFVSFDDSAAGLKIAVERFVAAKARASAFDNLVKRLPAYSFSWTDIATHCMQMMGSPAQVD